MSLNFFLMYCEFILQSLEELLIQNVKEKDESDFLNCKNILSVSLKVYNTYVLNNYSVNLS